MAPPMDKMTCTPLAWHCTMHVSNYLNHTMHSFQSISTACASAHALRLLLPCLLAHARCKILCEFGLSKSLGVMQIRLVISSCIGMATGTWHQAAFADAHKSYLPDLALTLSICGNFKRQQSPGHVAPHPRQPSEQGRRLECGEV